MRIQENIKHGRTLFFRYEHLLNSDFFDTTRERQFLKVFRIIRCKQNSNARHISWSFRSQFIFAGRYPKNLTVCLNCRNPNYSTPWQITQFSMPQWQRQKFSACLAYSKLQKLALFQNLQILETIASEHDVIHTPVSFPVWGLL